MFEPNRVIGGVRKGVRLAPVLLKQPSPSFSHGMETLNRHELFLHKNLLFLKVSRLHSQQLSILINSLHLKFKLQSNTAESFFQKDKL